MPRSRSSYLHRMLALSVEWSTESHESIAYIRPQQQQNTEKQQQRHVIISKHKPDTFPNEQRQTAIAVIIFTYLETVDIILLSNLYVIVMSCQTYSTIFSTMVKRQRVGRNETEHGGECLSFNSVVHESKAPASGDISAVAVS